MKKTSLLSSRKGVFYLLLSSLFIALMIVVFLAYKEYSYTDRQKVFDTRIRSTSDFIRSIDTDSKRVIYISGFRSLIAIEDYVARISNYTFDDTEEIFRIAFYNGTVNGTQVDVLKDSTYSDYLNKLKVIAGTIGLDINISIPNITGITLYQESPWQVIVNVTVQVNLTDRTGIARWNFNKTYSANVSIISIRDPVYSVSTHGLVPNPIRMTPNNLIPFVTGTNTVNLMNLTNNSYYIQDPLAPSFLMRLKGRLNESSACCGIQSLVNIPSLIIQGVTYDNSRSIVDYILFSNITGYDNVSCVQNTTSWFKIDENHSVQYEVDGLLYSCP
jgi:hypothetical protein